MVLVHPFLAFVDNNWISRHRILVILGGGVSILALVLIIILRATGVIPNTPVVSDAGFAISGKVKIFINDGGMYEVDTQKLSNFGLQPEGVEANEFRLTYRGREQPVWVIPRGNGFRIRFYGQASESRYSLENVYILEWGKGEGTLMEIDTNQSISDGPHQLTAVARMVYEENSIYLPQVPEGDHWFWLSMPAPADELVHLKLTEVKAGAAELRIGVYASTEALVNPDHHILIRVNNQTIDEERWDGKGWYQITIKIPNGLLHAGENILHLESVGDTNAPADIIYLNRITIFYPKELKAERNRLEFIGTNAPLELVGFNGDVDIFEVEPENTRVAGQVNATKVGGVVFQGKENVHYVAVAGSGYQEPMRLQSIQAIPSLKGDGVTEQDTSVDYIAIGPPELLEPLQPLLERRKDSGLDVLSIPIQAIYDQFNHGFPEPEALQYFLRYAHTNWERPPRFMLLVGDATYDPRGYIAPVEQNRLPTFLVQTEFGGETASDIPFTLIDGDEQPDIAIGRIPANEPGQVRDWVNKIIEYEKNSAGRGASQKILAIADGQDASFRGDAVEFLELFPGLYDKELFSPAPGAEGANQQIVRYLDKGALMVAYFGHGSVNMWGKDKLFTSMDVDLLGGGESIPLILNMTCLTGLFTHPKATSLSEMLLLNPRGGALSLLAPTSLTLPTDQGYLTRGIIHAYLENPTSTLGEILLEAQRQMPVDQPGVRDVMYTYLLLGDPGFWFTQPLP